MRLLVPVLVLCAAASPATAVEFNLRDPNLIGSGGPSLTLTAGGVTATLTASPMGTLLLGPQGFGVQSPGDTGSLVTSPEYITIRFDQDVLWDRFVVSAQESGGCSTRQFTGTGTPQAPFQFCGSGTFTNGAGQMLAAQTGMVRFQASDTNGFSLDSISVTPVVPPPSNIIHFTSSSQRTTEADGVCYVHVTRENGQPGEVRVDYATRAVTATANVDYVETAGTLVIPDHVSFGSIPVPIIDDPDAEGVETFEVVLSNPSAGAVLTEPSVVTVEIDANDIPAGIIEFDPAANPTLVGTRQYEVGEGDGSVTLKVVRRDGATGRVTVRAKTESRSARQDQDFVGIDEVLVLDEGETEKSFTISIIDDPDGESDEEFEVELSGPTGGASLGGFFPSRAIVKIFDNDALARVTFRDDLFSTEISEHAGTASVVVQITANNLILSGTGTIEVDCRLREGSAISGIDYDGASLHLTFPHDRGESDSPFVNYGNDYGATISIPIHDNEELDGNKVFYFDIVSAAGQSRPVEVPVETIAFTIADDELPAGQFRFTQEVFEVEPFRTNSVLITVERIGGAEGTVTVDYATVEDGNHSAIPGFHYVPTSGTLTFEPDQRTATFSVTVGNDPSKNETYALVSLGNATHGAGLAFSRAAASIKIKHTSDFFGSIFAILCGPGIGTASLASIATLLGAKRRRNRRSAAHGVATTPDSAAPASPEAGIWSKLAECPRRWSNTN